MTPLTGLAEVSSLGSFIEGVQISPDMAAVRGATLTITPAHAVAAGRLRAVTFAKDGSGMQEVPVLVSHGQLVVGFSGLESVAILDHGSGKAAVATERRAPGDGLGEAGYGRFYAQLLSGTVQDWSAGNLSDDDFLSSARSILDEYKADIISNEVEPGAKDDAAAEQAIHDLLAEEQQRQLLGFDQDFSIFSLVNKLLAGIYNRAQTRCAQQHDLSQVDIALDAYRTMVLAGHPENVPLDKLFACVRFKVSFDSTMTEVHGGSWHGTNTNEYTGAISIKRSFQQAGYPLTGRATGSYAQATGNTVGDPQDCTDVQGTETPHLDEVGATPAPVSVGEFNGPSNRINGPPPQLELEVGFPTETYHGYSTGDCPDSSPPGPAPIWAGLFGMVHRGEIDGTFPNTYLLSLNPGSNATIATRTWNRSFVSGDDSDTEHTVVTVTHRPGKFAPL